MSSFSFLKKYSVDRPKIVTLFAFVLLFIISAKAQEKVTDTRKGRVLVTDDRLPVYPGGADAFYKFITSNIRYPELALKDSIRGTIFLRFDVEKDGQLTNISVTRGLNEKLDREIVRIAKISPKWLPAQENRIAVKQFF